MQKETHGKFTGQFTTATLKIVSKPKYNYTFQDSIVGEGAFGTVRIATRNEDGRKVAVKTVLQDPKYRNRELDVLKDLEHENVACMIDHFFIEDRGGMYLCIVMDFMPSTLLEEIKTYTRAKSTMSMTTVKRIIYQLLMGLHYFHSKGYTHRDIKTTNVLVDSQRGIVQLCDFGSAKKIAPGEASISYICSRYYRAPELCLGATHYNQKVDVWSVGCVMGEMLSGRPLFEGANGEQQFAEIVRTRGSPTMDDISSMVPGIERTPVLSSMERLTALRLPSRLNKLPRLDQDPLALAFLEEMLTYNPAKRPSALRLMHHAFFDDVRPRAATAQTSQQNQNQQQ